MPLHRQGLEDPQGPAVDPQVLHAVAHDQVHAATVTGQVRTEAAPAKLALLAPVLQTAVSHRKDQAGAAIHHQGHLMFATIVEDAALRFVQAGGPAVAHDQFQGTTVGQAQPGAQALIVAAVVEDGPRLQDRRGQVQMDGEPAGGASAAVVGPAGKAEKRMNPVIALDTATGKTMWQISLPMDGGRDHGCGSSKVMDLAGTKVLITAGGHVMRIKDGRPLLSSALGKEDPCNGQTEIATDDASDTLFYFPGKGQGTVSEVVAVKLTLSGDSVQEQELWRKPVKGAGHTMVVHRGRLYTGCDVIDLATGEVTAWTQDQRGRVPTRWLLAATDTHLYGLGTDGVATVLDLTTGKQISRNAVTPRTSDPDLIARHLAINANAQMDFSYAAPFTIVGDRILMRCYDHLYCIAGH